jgi:hypothetical protein
MGKLELTKQLELSLFKNTYSRGTFRCLEVTITKHGRVDYLTYNMNNEIWKFYEIKISKQDFYSKSKHTFLGHYNYYVFPEGLYEEVKKDIPDYIGVFEINKNNISSVKRAKKQKLRTNKQILINSFIRSLTRDAEKYIKNQDNNLYTGMKKKLSRVEKELRESRYTEKQNMHEVYRLQRILRENNIDFR